MNEFKAGDKVYCPIWSTKVLTLCVRDNPKYPVFADMGSGYMPVFTIGGKGYIKDVLPSIFHATPEMKAKLEDFYGVEFEAPPTKPTSKEIVKAMLNKSTEPVPCWVSNNSDRTQPTRKDTWVFIEKDCIEDCDDGRFSDFPYRDSTGKHWKYATPFDPHTVEAITELPE